MTLSAVKCDGAKVDVNQRCHQGFTPLQTASMAGYRYHHTAVVTSSLHIHRGQVLRGGAPLQQVPRPGPAVAGDGARDDSGEERAQEGSPDHHGQWLRISTIYITYLHMSQMLYAGQSAREIVTFLSDF